MTAGNEAERLRSVLITRRSVRRGDVLVIGGRQMQVVEVVRTAYGARLGFKGGEWLWLTNRSELNGLRGPVPGAGGEL
ncbi:hypothetical protein FNQ90_11810 [Streptomyces alkaliphilus]|uniref:Uncharacterized protein n=1 Tax=Streptomyces alkaliphilus TaxID=1472722 RepID=A0A7W3TDC5_9ACTN|nr:hypothetical protein [Streptomyces alkaliphilus]MBB0244771.1 hypothetical protein [Streptomyces alkaliphilus]